MEANLLSIETDYLIRINLTRRLDRKGFKVFPALSPAEIKRLVKKKRIDVALLDLSGLKLEGLKLLKLVKKVNPLTEIITLSTAECMPLSIEGMKLGAFDDLLIPVDVGALIQRIETACSQKKEKEKQKTAALSRYEKIMMAAAFAEAGDPETAKAILDKNKNKPVDSGYKGESNDGKK